VHHQDARWTITEDPESVLDTSGHRHPMPCAYDQLLVTAAQCHLSLQDVPGVVEVVVHVQRWGRAGRQRHFEHHGGHFRGATVLDDQGIEEPPGLSLFAVRRINDCSAHFGPPSA